MSPFTIYLLGACLSGLIFLLLTCIKSFYGFLSNSIDNAKQEMKNEGKLSDMERTLLDGIPNESTIDFLNGIVIVLSWLGLVLTIVYVATWIFNNKI